MSARNFFIYSAFLMLFAVAALCLFSIKFAYLFFIVIPYILIGLYDMLQSTHNILRNYPVFGHIRYIFEFVRPEIQQYFVATNQSGRPFNREMRSVVYQRAKQVNDTLPFGTQQNITEPGYEFASHSMNPCKVDERFTRLTIGNEQCKKPYNASRLNISAMSFGALSHTAVEALNWGAKLGNFAHNTGEGGLTAYHLKHEGDIVWQLGTANFGCRTKEGNFCSQKFKEKANLPQVKMIEIKISQGAKPSHGGLLPAAKIDKEVAEIRGIEMGKDCLSPPTNPAFSTPIGLLNFVTQLRELTGGKPVGFKLAIGIKSEFMSICKAMMKTQIYPDFITIDGAEGGTGAAPLEFSNSLGLPINEALAFVHSTLTGCNLRDKVTLIASGKVATGFEMLSKIAIGADACNCARAMLFAVGCIQALKCNTNECPTGVTTQNKKRASALIPKEKRHHVYHFHKATVESCFDLIGALGIDSPDKLSPEHILHRVAEGSTKNYAELYHYLKPGELLGQSIPENYRNDWLKADAEHF